ncbi:MAG TPA: ABC transporter permease, partial [Trueperaceae bacterium]|nr:ABC transporter permease [Trueperaceae bacterium]
EPWGVRALVPYLAWRHVRRRGLQSALTVAGVAVGVAVLIVALSLTNGFIDELIRSTLRATPMLTLQNYLPGETLPDDRGLLAALGGEPGVTAVAPFLSGQALIARRASQSLGVTARQGFTQIVGIDTKLETAVLDLPVLAEQADALAEAGGVVLGSTLAQSLGVSLGDMVMLRDISGATAQFKVAGTFRVGNELIDSVTSYMSLANLQDYLGVAGRITGYHLRLADPGAAHSIGLELAGKYSLRPISWESLFASLISQLRLQKAVIGVVVFLIVIVAAFGITNVMVLTVNEKTEDIAILRALGASERQILATFTLQGFLLGGAGTALGALLGLAVAAYFKFQPYPLPGDLYFITQLPVQLQAWDVIWVCGVSFVTSVVAGLLPARRAARLDPVAVLR